MFQILSYTDFIDLKKHENSNIRATPDETEATDSTEGTPAISEVSKSDLQISKSDSIQSYVDLLELHCDRNSIEHKLHDQDITCQKNDSNISSVIIIDEQKCGSNREQQKFTQKNMYDENPFPVLQSNDKMISNTYEQSQSVIGNKFSSTNFMDKIEDNIIIKGQKLTLQNDTLDTESVTQTDDIQFGCSGEDTTCNSTVSVRNCDTDTNTIECDTSRAQSPTSQQDSDYGQLPDLDKNHDFPLMPPTYKAVEEKFGMVFCDFPVVRY